MQKRTLLHGAQITLKSNTVPNIFRKQKSMRTTKIIKFNPENYATKYYSRTVKLTVNTTMNHIIMANPSSKPKP